MSTNLNYWAFKDLVIQDIAWLIRNTSDSLERKHIIDILEKTPERFYGLATEKEGNRRFKNPAEKIMIGASFAIIECPHCGYEAGDWLKDPRGIENFKCDNCSQTFSVPDDCEVELT